MPTRAFLFFETATLRAENKALKNLKIAVQMGDLFEAQKLARQHDDAWVRAEDSFTTTGQPHRNNDFCDDE
jgi:hypothetical protein